MRVLHVSDTHLGHSAYRKVDEASGLNQREVDVYASFEEFVDRAIELSPDAVLHSGDLFDSVRPTNRALSFAIEQLMRLSYEGIPVVIIAGNHESPRLRETGSVLRVLEHIPGVHPVYKGGYELVEVGDLSVHAIPHCDQDPMREGLERLVPTGEYDVAMLHAGVVGLGVFKMGEFNEALINSSYLHSDMRYIALGHYHGCTQVEERAWYSGSTERFSFKEANEQKGFLEVDLDRHRVEFHRLEAREMLDLPPIEAKRMGGAELSEAVRQALEEQDLEGRIVRLTAREVSAAAYKGLDFRNIADWASGALHLERRFEVVHRGGSVQWSDAAIGPLEQEYALFLERYPVEGVDKDRIGDLGAEYIRRGVGESD